MEIRIYYGTIEQGCHYVRPIIEQILSENQFKVDVKAIRLSKNFSDYSEKIAPIIYAKDPDLLITFLLNEVEYPLFFIELSAAVFTEDHELQRFDGMIAAVTNETFYVKINRNFVNLEICYQYVLLMKLYWRIFYS